MTIQIRRIHTTNVDVNTISFFSSKKRSHYNLSNLYKELVFKMRMLNMRNSCHLTAYPYIAVHVTNRDLSYLNKNHELIKETVESILFEMMA